MKQINHWLSYLLMGFFLTWFPSCKKSSDELGSKAPAESYTADTLRGRQQQSIVNIPVEIPMAEVERQINSQLKDLLYEDNDPNDNGGDNFLIKVWKKDNIRVDARGEVFNVTLPLKVWAKAGYKFEQFGIRLQDSRETDFELDVKFVTKVALNNNWKVQTTTSANGFDWVTKPVLRIGPIEIPLASIVGDIIDKQQDRLAPLLDQQIQDKVDIKPYVLQAWTLMQEPLLLSRQYDTWLQITPTEVLMTPLVGQGDRTRALLGIKAFTQTVIGRKPEVTPNPNIPNLTQVSQMPDDFRIGLSGEVSHQYAAKMAAKEFVGHQYAFNDGKYKVEITAIDLYGNGANLVIKAGLKGSVNGIIYLKGKPHYDPATQSLTLQNLDYDLDTKNRLIKTANWLAQGRFTRMMQEAFRIPLQNQIEEARQLIQSNLNNNRVAKGIVINGTLEELIPENVYMTPNSIVAIVTAKGKVAVKIDGL